jgi:hypothetical protein
MPWRQLFQNEDALEQRDVVADRWSRYLKRCCKLTYVDQPGRLRSGQFE